MNLCSHLGNRCPQQWYRMSLSRHGCYEQATEGHVLDTSLLMHLRT